MTNLYAQNMQKTIDKLEQENARLHTELAARPVADAGEAVAWVTPLRYGSRVTFYQPPKPDQWDDGEEQWYCYPLYRAAPSARTLSDTAILAQFEVVREQGKFHSLALPTDAAILAFARAILAARSTPANTWHDAVLAECMSIEGGYNPADPVATVQALIDWHVQTDRDLAARAPAEAPSVRDRALEEAAHYVESEIVLSVDPMKIRAAYAKGIRALQGKPEAAKGEQS